MYILKHVLFGNFGAISINKTYKMQYNWASLPCTGLKKDCHNLMDEIANNTEKLWGFPKRSSVVVIALIHQNSKKHVLL